MEDLSRALTATLSPHAAQRQSAEEALSQMLSQPGISIALTQLALDQSSEIPLRQISSIFVCRDPDLSDFPSARSCSSPEATGPLTLVSLL